MKANLLLPYPFSNYLNLGILITCFEQVLHSMPSFLIHRVNFYQGKYELSVYMILKF